MTPEQVAEGQLHAAWISAGAAIVQAFGAVAAIIASIVLARGSAKREAKANAAAAERERRADEAAERRAREARDAAAQQLADADAAARRREEDAAIMAKARSQKEEIVRHKERVDAAITLGDRALAFYKVELQAWQARVAAGDKATYGSGSQNALLLTEVAASLSDLRREMPPESAVRMPLAELIRLIEPSSAAWGMGTAEAIASSFYNRVSYIEAQLKLLRAESSSLGPDSAEPASTPRS